MVRRKLRPGMEAPIMVSNAIHTSDEFKAHSEQSTLDCAPVMRKRLAKQLFSVALALAIPGSGSAQIARTVGGNVSAWVGRAQKLRAADENLRVTVAAYRASGTKLRSRA